MTTATMTSRASVRQQAESLAKANREADPDIGDIYWFPADDEIRLVEVVRTPVPTSGDELEPFYFAPVPADGIDLRSAVALINLEEAGKLKLPTGWGTWNNAKKL